VLRPLARQAFAAVSNNRSTISRLLGMRSELELRERLMGVRVPPCLIRDES